MKLIAVTDIFGKTKYLEALLSCFSKKYNSIKIIDPYLGFEIEFEDESAAYQHFQDKIGLDGYIKKLLSYLQNDEHSDQHLLGFSVGASAVWAVSGVLNLTDQSKAVCFYGSQIRHFLTINPNFKADLYFPTSEPHFEVDDVMMALKQKSNVMCFKTNYLHGFMNMKSINFNRTAYEEYINILHQLLSYGE